MEIKNEKNEYKLEKNSLFGDKGSYYWPGTFDEALYLLRQAPYSPNIPHLFEINPLTEEVENEVQSWSFALIVKSALYFLLKEKIEERKKNKLNSLSKYDWPLIVPLMLNQSINKEIILFIEENYKVPYDFIIVAAHFSIKRLILFNQLIISQNSLNDFLIFLKIDVLSRQILVKRCFRNQNFDQLADFLFALNSSLNQDLIFSEVLKNYNSYGKDKNFYFDLEQIEIKVGELLELKRDALETFDVFDMFESFELVKSKSSALHFFSFYENLLEDSNGSLNEDFIKIFKLFEEFLNGSKDKSILLVEISFEKSSQFYKIIKSFSFSYQEKIKNILIDKSRSLKKFSQAGIDYKSIGFGGLLTSVAFLHVLGFESNKRPNYPPSSHGCFATMSSNFGRTINVRRVESEYDAIRSMSASATSQPLQQKISNIQKRPLPTNTTLAANRSKNSGIITYSKASLNTDFDKKLVQTSKGNNRFDGLSATDCMDLIAKEVSKKFPGSFISIQPKILIINGIPQEGNEITISRTFSQFGRLNRVKTYIIKSVKQTDGTILFSSFKNYDRDHVLNSVTRDIFNIKEERGAAVFVEKLVHEKLGKERTYLTPNGLGYTPKTGGSLSIIDHFREEDGLIIESLMNDREFTDSLTSTNSSPEELKRTYTRAFELDQELIRTRMGDQIDENSHLAMSHSTYINEQTTSEFDSISDRLSANDNQDMQRAAGIVDQLLDDAQPRREHTHAVKALLKEGTLAHSKVVRSESRALNAASELIEYIENNGGKVNPATKQTFFATTSSNLMAPDQACSAALTTMGLEDLKQPLDKLSGPKLFVTNYPKK